MKRRPWGVAGVAALSLVLVMRLALAQGELRNDAPPPQDLNAPPAATAPAAPAPGAATAEAPPAAGTMTPPDLGPLQLTIFTDGHALVRHREAFSLTAGMNTVQVANVARLLDPTSVRLRPLEAAEGLRVLEQTTTNAATTSRELLAAAVGKPVRVRDGRYTVDGTLVAVEDGGVIVSSNSELHIHPAGELILPQPQDVPNLTPGLSWRLEAKTTGPLQAEVSYLTGGLTWSADYAVTVADHNRQLSFDGWVRVANSAGTAFDDAGLILANAPSGAAPATTPATPAATPAVATPAAPATTMPATGEAAARYFLPRKVSLPDASAKRFSLVSVPAARSAVRFVATVTPTAVQGVRLVAELANTVANGLGQPLPPGPVRLYAPDRLGRLDLVGQQTLAATPLDAPLRFDLGPADGVEVTARSVPQPDGSTRRVVTVRNLRTEDVTVRVVERRPGTWTVTAASATFTTPADGSASAELTVPANAAKDLTYTLRTTPATAGGSTA